MGQLLAAPFGASGSCIGSCAGSALAAGCGKLASSGTLDSERAACVMLLWLQAFTTAVALTVAATAHTWLPWACGYLQLIGQETLGVCGCRPCWHEQLTYRAELAGFAVFVALFVMSCSGCGHAASRSATVGKFMAVPLISFAMLLLPCGMLAGFGKLASSAAAAFLVAQALLLMDFAYSWNEAWHGFAVKAECRELNREKKKMWLGLIVLASAVLFIAALACTAALVAAYPESREFIGAAAAIGVVLLVLSITDWCEHGALLPSCVMLLYTVFVVYEALPGQQRWPGLLLAAISLSASAYGGTETLTETERQENNPRDFATQCAVQAAAALYVTSRLANEEGRVEHVLHVAAVFLVLLLYGWSLVAPMLLTNRDFR